MSTAVGTTPPLQGLELNRQHRKKMWKGKREVKLICTKSMRELGIEKKRFGESWARNYPVGEVTSLVWHALAMLFSMSAALMSCFPMPSCISMHSLMASVNGLPGKEEAFLLEKSHLMLKKVLPFFLGRG